MNVHALLAVGINRDGHREILGLDVSSGEDKAGWLTSLFFRGLVARGLSGVKLVTSDAHAGFVAAIGAIATWCVVATLPNALRGELDVDHSENAMAWGVPPGWSP